MTKFRRWELQWIAKDVGAFSEGYGRRAYFLRLTAVLALLMHFMEYGHLFDYRIRYRGETRFQFPNEREIQWVA